MPVKTDLGGRARLQKAICLDSLGQNKEAYAVYSQIERHPSNDVAKQAKRSVVQSLYCRRSMQFAMVQAV